MAEPIEVSPAPDLYEVEFEFAKQLGVSVILPATCALMAQMEAWRLFPEHKMNASAVSVYNVEYVEMDWESGRCIVLKRKKRPAIPMFVMGEPKTHNRKLNRGKESEE